MGHSSRIAFRGIWLAIIILAAVVVGSLAGWVFYAIGALLPTAIGAASTVFVGVVCIGIKVWTFLVE
ncbi:MAG: hypothetical protein ACRDS0_09540 [Pseudonocardiaceae bacterium]